MISLEKASDYFYLLKFGEKPVAALAVVNEKLHIIAAEQDVVTVVK